MRGVLLDRPWNTKSGGIGLQISQCRPIHQRAASCFLSSRERSPLSLPPSPPFSHFTLSTFFCPRSFLPSLEPTLETEDSQDGCRFWPTPESLDSRPIQCLRIAPCNTKSGGIGLQISHNAAPPTSAQHPTSSPQERDPLSPSLSPSLP